MSTWQWICAAPRWPILVGAIAATWGAWLAHTHGRELERARWEAFRAQTHLHCIRPPEAYRGET